MINRLKAMLPYAFALLLFGYLYYVTTQLTYDAGPDRLGPGAWPKGILYLAFITCAYGIVRNTLYPKRASELEDVVAGIKSKFTGKLENDLKESSEAYPYRLLTGIVLTAAFPVMLAVLGFVLAAALYIASLAYTGGYRNWWGIAGSSAVGVLLLMFLFMKVVYVSFPIGQEPFSIVMLTLMQFMNIK